MPAHPIPAPPKPPTQKRGRQTLKRIVEATERLLRRQRFEDITVAQIVAEADTSTGSFYARFVSKDALLPHLYETYNTSTAAATDELKRRNMTARTLREAVATLIGLLREGPVKMDQLVRTMTLYARSHPERLPESAFVRSHGFYDVMAALLAPHMKARDADRRARFAAFAAATLLREHQLFPDAPLAKALGLSDEAFAAAVREMTEAYLAGAR
jgi:AcrR family transcriptional regulator